VVNLSRLAHGSRADGAGGLLGAQPGRPKFDVLPVPGTGNLSWGWRARPMRASRLRSRAAPGAVTGAPANRSPGQV